MGISLSIPCDPCINKVFQWLDNRGSYTYNLKKNLTTLETTMEELKAKRDDLSRRVTREEDVGLQRLAKIKVWFTRVETVEKNISNLLGDDGNVKHQKLYLCGFCSNKSTRSSYGYGKKVFLALKDVQKLNSEVFEVVTEEAQTTEVEERPIQPIIVGQETILDKAWKHLMDDEVGTMGIYGMGGVGKTTLLVQLNNKFSGERCGFDFVIWVVVSKETHLEKIQDEISQKVGFHGGENQKRVNLYNFLRKKRFLLFLDDIWEKLDLAEIGVPFPTTKNRCKVVFTTRSQDVCARMGVEDPMEVQCLAENDALDLFRKKVGQRTLGSDPEIPNLARIVARKCSGLPLALSVIGETMSCKRTVKEWHDAINVLDSYAVEFSGMEEKILPLLKYSYDDLKEDNVKKCLLYCALFPEDDIIPKEKLIEYWICEKIIDGRGGIERAENKGYAIIGSLVRASLLLDEFSLHEMDSTVHMHDVIREMALWIASDLGIQKEAYIVHAGDRLDKMPKVENWNLVRRMSLMKNNIKCHLTGSYECLELTTLLLQNSNLENISSEFFKSMPKLVVLDLSDNRKLTEIPDTISELGSLQYLNLSKTAIRELPMGLRELRKLIHLDLEKTDSLLNIVGISSLHNLKVLKLAFSYISWDLGTVEELITLEHLEILTTSFYDTPPPYVEKFLSSNRLAGSTRTLKITNMDAESSKILFLVTMDKLRDFIVTDCSISEIKLGSICIKGKIVSLVQNPRNPCFLSLSYVCIAACKGLKELTFLMFAPNIKSLEVDSSNELEDIISKEKVCEGGDESSSIIPFPKLITLTLHFLRNLKSIYWRPLPFLCLKTINIVQCPNLKKLPLDSQSCKEGEDGLIIKYGEKGWIDGLEWEDEVTKTRFLSSSK